MASARIVSLDGTSPDAIAIDVFVGHQNPGQMGIGFQYDIAYERRPVAGAEVDWRSRPSPPHRFEGLDWVVVAATPTERGAWRLEGLEITYRSGWFRQRTAIIDGRHCLLTTNHGAEMSYEPDAGPPSDVDPAHWAFYQECSASH